MTSTPTATAPPATTTTKTPSPLSDEDYIYAVWDEVDPSVDTVMDFPR